MTKDQIGFAISKGKWVEPNDTSCVVCGRSSPVPEGRIDAAGTRPLFGYVHAECSPKSPHERLELTQRMVAARGED
jgi:hypothetical protein